MIEHTEWLASEYQQGIDGQRIAIIGYSHHDPDLENEKTNVTNTTLRAVVEQSGIAKELVFFTHIQNYFGYEATNEFWNRVLFFNFVPDLVGTDRWASATPAQIKRGRQRFARILDEHVPNKALVFSIKGWNQLCVEQKKEYGPSPLQLSDDETKPVYGTYIGGGGATQVYQLRHPLYAAKREMTDRVREILKQPVS